MVLLHLPLEDASHMLNGVQVWRHTWPLHYLHLQQQGSCHLGGVFGVVMLEKRFWREGIIFCFRMSQYVWIHVFLNEPQLPSTSSSHAAPDHDTTTPMLDCRQGKIFTIWVKQVYIRLIRPQDMVPVIHALCQVVFGKLFAGFFCEPASEEAFFWDDGRANRLVAVCGVWSEHWQADLPLLQPLKQCRQHSCICFLKPASAPDAQHKDSTSLIDPCKACFRNPSWKTSVWPWPLYCNSVSGCYQTSYGLGHLCGEQQF